MVNRSSIFNDEIETKVFWWNASVCLFFLVLLFFFLLLFSLFLPEDLYLPVVDSWMIADI